MSAQDAVPDTAHESSQLPVPAATLDAYGLTCGALEPLIAQHLRALSPGEVLEIRSDMDEAADGIAAWVWLAGHTVIAVHKEQPPPRARYYIRKKTPKT
jgi:TusA-related sulfurtransferase